MTDYYIVDNILSKNTANSFKQYVYKCINIHNIMDIEKLKGLMRMIKKESKKKTSSISGKGEGATYRSSFRALIKPIYDPGSDHVSPNNKLVNSYIYGTDQRVSPRNHISNSKLISIIED